MFPACSLPTTVVTGDRAVMTCDPQGLPSARMVKGESPGLLAENWPPRDVIRKQRLKKPIPTTKILQETRTEFKVHERDGEGEKKTDAGQEQ